MDDVILRYNGESVQNDDHLSNLVSLTPIGNEVEMIVLRDRQRLQLKVKVRPRSDFEDD